MSFIMIPSEKEDFIEELNVEDEKKPSGKSKKLVIIILAVNTLLLAAAVVYFLFIYDKGGSKEGAEEKAAHESSEKKDEKESGKEEKSKEKGKKDEKKKSGEGVNMGLITELEPFIVNLDDVNSSKFLKMKISIELDSAAAQTELEEKKIVIRDAILTFISSLKVSDTAGIDGKASIKEEIINRINNILSSGKAKNVYYNEFVVQ